jgi:hypothetical protein
MAEEDVLSKASGAGTAMVGEFGTEFRLSIDQKAGLKQPGFSSGWKSVSFLGALQLGRESLRSQEPLTRVEDYDSIAAAVRVLTRN